MKIVFFDIDGPLNTTASMMRSKKAYTLDENAVFFFNLIIKETKAQAVCCSTWRKGKYTEARAHVMRSLRIAGFEGKLHEDWRTPDIEDTDKDIRRGDEILEWLKRHPEVTHHVIIDDEGLYDDNQGSYREGQPIVQCDQNNGLGWKDYKMAVMLLGGAKDKFDVDFFDWYNKWVPRVCSNNYKTAMMLMQEKDKALLKELREHKESMGFNGVALE